MLTILSVRLTTTSSFLAARQGFHDTQSVTINLECFPGLHAKRVFTTTSQEGKGDREAVLTDTDCRLIPTFFRFPTPFTSLFDYFLSCVFYLLISLLSTFRSFQIPSLLPLSRCLTPPCGSVQGGAALVMSREECSRYGRSSEGRSLASEERVHQTGKCQEA